MSLIRQIWLLLAATVLLALAGSVAVAVTSARDTLRSAVAHEERRQRAVAGAGAVAAHRRAAGDGDAAGGAVRQRPVPAHPSSSRPTAASASSGRANRAPARRRAGSPRWRRSSRARRGAGLRRAEGARRGRGRDASRVRARRPVARHVALGGAARAGRHRRRAGRRPSRCAASGARSKPPWRRPTRWSKAASFACSSRACPSCSASPKR